MDAKSTAVAVRVNLVTYRIQVVDNGKGITSFNMNSVGLRYMTTKCQSLADLKHNTKRYGFRGEALASIAEASGKLTISSRSKGTNSTYTKLFESGKMGNVFAVKERPEHGTTVTVENFLQNMHVRQQRIKQDLDLDEIKNNMKYLAVIRPQVSFTLRNDANGKIILTVNKTRSVSEALVNIFPEIDNEDLAEFKVSKKHFDIAGLVCQKSKENKHLQLIYVNRRPVVCHEIQKLIKNLYLKACNSSKSTNISFNKNEHPVYVLNVRYACTNIDITLHPSKTTVMFRKLDDLLECVQQTFCKFWEIEPSKPAERTEKNHNTCKVKSNYGVSIVGAIKSLPVKRKLANGGENTQKKLKAAEKQLNFLEDEENTSKLKQFSNECSKYPTPDLFEESIVDYNCVPNEEENQLTIHQEKGKDIIMNKFLKSIETYKSHTEPLESESSLSEVLVEKTEKNLFTAKKDQNTTMTFSVKIQTEKTLRKKKAAKKPAYRSDQFVTKCVQTTFLEDNSYSRVEKINKTSKCIQTSIDEPFEYRNSDVIEGFGTDTNCGNNYTENFLSVSQYFQNDCDQHEEIVFGNEIQPFKKPNVDLFVHNRKVT